MRDATRRSTIGRIVGGRYAPALYGVPTAQLSIRQAATAPRAPHARVPQIARSRIATERAGGERSFANAAHRVATRAHRRLGGCGSCGRPARFSSESTDTMNQTNPKLTRTASAWLDARRMPL